jgi:hypothetical protein
MLIYFFEIGRELSLCIKLSLIVFLFVHFIGPLITLLYQAKEVEETMESVV